MYDFLSFETGPLENCFVTLSADNQYTLYLKFFTETQVFYFEDMAIDTVNRFWFDIEARQSMLDNFKTSGAFKKMMPIHQYHTVLRQHGIKFDLDIHSLVFTPVSFSGSIKELWL